MSPIQTGYEELTLINLKELKDSEERLRIHFSHALEFCSLFLMPMNQSDPESISSSETLINKLSSSLAFRREVNAFPDIFSSILKSNDCLLYSLIFENIEPSYIKLVLHDKIQEISGINHRSIRYNKYGLFIPREGRIICFAFAHSGSMYYRYRLAEFKLKNVPFDLNNYLVSLLSYCPNEYFFSGSRASGYILKMKINMQHTHSHRLSSLTASALVSGKLRSGHENVEKYLLESDPGTIACEVPVWYEQSQNGRLSIEGVLTGHIDILRYEKNCMIEIWDYKPRARYEKKAHMQVYLYTVMLSQRTGIPLNNFLCGYFDQTDAYFFNAKDVTW